MGSICAQPQLLVYQNCLCGSAKPTLLRRPTNLEVFSKHETHQQLALEMNDFLANLLHHSHPEMTIMRVCRCLKYLFNLLKMYCLTTVPFQFVENGLTTCFVNQERPRQTRARRVDGV